MKKEPLMLYLLRFLFALGMFAFMAMLYWSSLLVEDRLKSVQSELSDIKEELESIKSNPVSDTSHPSVESAPSKPQPSQMQTVAQLIANRKQIDPQYPNLLSDDPFYLKTLPKMLGPHFKPKGIRKDATYGKPQNLHPFAPYADVQQWQGACGVAVAGNAFGIYETFVPDMGIKVEERRNPETGVPEYWVHLRENVFWTPLHPDQFEGQITLAPHFLKKHPVTAHDFKFYFDAVMNPYVQEAGAVALRTYLGTIEEFRVIDDLTFVVRWKTKKVKGEDGKEELRPKYIAKQWTGALRALPRFVFQYFADGKKIIDDDDDPNTYRTNSVWAQNFAQHWAKNIIVCAGPWNFEEMTDRQISFKRNENYYFPLANLVQGLDVAFRENPDSVWQDFKTGKIDAYVLRPNQISEYERFLESDVYAEQVKKKNSVKRIDYLGRSFTYIGWNEAKPYFTSKRVRQALTMAIDRQRIVNNILNGMGVEVTGPEFIGSKDYDKSIEPWPFDPQAARRLLEEEGWFDSDGDGVLDKMIDGKKVYFRFSITYFVKNPTSEAVASYIATALKDIGIDVSLNGVDIADLTNSLEDKTFDALFLSWKQGTPPDDPRQIWHSSGAKEKGSSNMIGFANKEVDAIIDQLDYEYDEKKRVELFHRFHAILHDEQPYTFLYTPKISYLYREYLQNVFIPADRQDLIPKADVESPQASIFWLKTD